LQNAHMQKQRIARERHKTELRTYYC